MKKEVLVFNGSPRRNGNTSHMVQYFLKGAKQNTDIAEEIIAQNINLEYCRGCLRCNLLKKCSITGDDWEEISKKIIDSDVLVLATPIYFHHVSAPLKKIIDRFRSFINVQITEEGILHTPVGKWKKNFVLILCMGSSDNSDAKPVIELFEYMKSFLGEGNRLHIITATRLAVSKQVLKSEEELRLLYPKLNLPEHLAKEDYLRNQGILKQCFELGDRLTK